MRKDGRGAEEVKGGRECARKRKAPRRAVAPLGERGMSAKVSSRGDAGMPSCGDAASSFRVLTRLSERVRGLRGAEASEAHAVLVPCRDIHTFGMRCAIDVAFVDSSGTVAAVHRNVMPGRRIRHAEARLVVERRARAGRWLECGDCLFDAAFRNAADEGGAPSEDGDARFDAALSAGGDAR